MYKHGHTRLNNVHTRLFHYLYVPCTYYVHTCIYIHRNVHPLACMYMFMFFNNRIYHVCQPLYTSIVHTLHIHGSDMSVHVYARWSGFQMCTNAQAYRLFSLVSNPVYHFCELKWAEIYYYYYGYHDYSYYNNWYHRYDIAYDIIVETMIS